MRVLLPVAFLLLLIASPAAAVQPIQPWDGENPFNCELQQLGQGIDYPDPDADPLCVEFDKTQQNVAPSLGLVDFLSKEPGRVAAAVPKCFYFQHDHWTGSIVQDQAPELWNWDGSYFFDKARGRGGVYVDNLRFGGVPFDARPYAPVEYRPYLSPNGGGGVWLTGEFDASPECVAMVDTPEERAAIYRAAPLERNCADAGGNVGKRGVGRLRIGIKRARLRSMFGDPNRKGGGAERWCALGGGTIGAVFAKSGAMLVITTSPGHTIENVGPRSRAKRAQNRLELSHRFNAHGARVMAVKRKGAPAFIGVRKGRVRWIGVRSPGQLRGAKAHRRALQRYFRARPAD